MNDLLSTTKFIELYDYLADEEQYGQGPTLGKMMCDHTLHITLLWMQEQRIQPFWENIEKIVDLGGHCDCEVLMNVTPNTWEERREEEITGPHIMGEREWKQFLTDVLSESGYTA